MAYYPSDSIILEYNSTESYQPFLKALGLQIASISGLPFTESPLRYFSFPTLIVLGKRDTISSSCCIYLYDYELVVIRGSVKHSWPMVSLDISKLIALCLAPIGCAAEIELLQDLSDESCGYGGVCLQR